MTDFYHNRHKGKMQMTKIVSIVQSIVSIVVKHETRKGKRNLEV